MTTTLPQVTILNIFNSVTGNVFTPVCLSGTSIAQNIAMNFHREVVDAFSALTLMVGRQVGIRPVKTEWRGTGVLSAWNKVQMICIWTS